MWVSECVRMRVHPLMHINMRHKGRHFVRMRLGHNDLEHSNRLFPSPHSQFASLDYINNIISVMCAFFCFVLVFVSKDFFSEFWNYILICIMGNKMAKYATTNEQIQWNSRKSKQTNSVNGSLSMLIKSLTNKWMSLYHFIVCIVSVIHFDLCLQLHCVRTGWNVILWSWFLMSGVKTAKSNNSKCPYGSIMLPHLPTIR